MVVVFGWGGGRAKDLGEVAPATCPNCHNQVFLHHIHTEKQVSLYFVPMASYGSNEYLACPICHKGMQLAPQQMSQLQGMRAATALFRRGGLAENAYRASVEQFWAGLGVAPSGQQVLRAAASIPPPASIPSAATAEPSTTLAGQLDDLGRLHADGVLTDEEFAAAKRSLLGS